MSTSMKLENGPIQIVSVSRQVRGAFGLAGVALLGFGFLYAVIGVGLGQVFFPTTANGSLLEVDGKARGSSLVAQPFSDTRYFQARPSAAGYDPMSASGSNQARTNPQLRQRIRETQLAVAQREGVALAEVPKDLISQSGSGLDPHISVQAALIQANRVANARAIPRADIVSMINQYTEGKQLGVLGQARVNVLKLNMALDSYSKRL